MLIRRFFAFVISAFLIFFPAYSYAASPVGWVTSPTDIIINGASATVNAIKGAGASALKSTVSYAPTVANIGKNILKGGGGAAVGYAVYQVAGKAVDWVLDPANNRVKYTIPPVYGDHVCQVSGVGNLSVKDTIAHCKSAGYSSCRASEPYSNGTKVDVLFNYYGNNNYVYNKGCTGTLIPEQELYISVPTLAGKIQSNSAAGHAPSQEFVKTVVIDDVNTGVLDTPFNASAVPVTEAPPVDPPWDPSQPVPPFDPSSIIAAIKSVMAAVVNMSGVLSSKIDTLMFDLGLKHEQKIAADAANTAEIVAANDRTGAQVAAIAAAIADIEGNTLDGKVINDAVDRAIAAGNADTASIVAAIEAIEGNTLDGQLINDAIDRVIANDNANAQAAAEAADAAEAARAADAQAAADAAEAAKAADAANTAAVTDAIDAQTDAISETDPVTGVKSLKLPAFCSWALPVCDFFGWVAEPVPDDEEKKDVPFATTGDVGLDEVDRFEKRIEFSGQCPANDFSFTMMGVTYAKPIPYHHLCGFLEQIAPWLLAMCYLGTAYFVVENI